MKQASRSFHTTHWSIVLAAGSPSAPNAGEALAALCESYWYPLYAHIRRSGYPQHQAEDLTQDFFADLLQRKDLHVADRARGKFRSFLLSAVNHFLANARRRARAKKRGGGRPLLSLDFQSAERRLHHEPAHQLTAEKVYERRWAITLLERALARLRDELVARDRLTLFDRLKGQLGGDSSVPLAHVARELSMSEGAVKVAVHRLRRRCRELLRQEIAETVAQPADIDDELRALLDAVGP